jgi:hypothetical protein
MVNQSILFANPYYLLKDPLSTPLPKLQLLVPMSAQLRVLIMSQFFFLSGLSCFVQRLNLFIDPVVNWFFFCFGFAGFLRMNSLSRIGEAEGFIRFFSIYV